MCDVIVNTVVKKERIGEETGRVVGCGNGEFEHVEDRPCEKVDRELGVGVPCRSRLRRGGGCGAEFSKEERKSTGKDETEEDAKGESCDGDLKRSRGVGCRDDVLIRVLVDNPA